MCVQSSVYKRWGGCKQSGVVRWWCVRTCAFVCACVLAFLLVRVCARVLSCVRAHMHSYAHVCSLSCMCVCACVCSVCVPFVRSCGHACVCVFYIKPSFGLLGMHSQYMRRHTVTNYYVITFNWTAVSMEPWSLPPHTVSSAFDTLWLSETIGLHHTWGFEMEFYQTSFDSMKNKETFNKKL